MNLKTIGRLWVSIFVVLIMIINTLPFISNSSVSENDDNLGIVYLSKSQYLLPDPPADEPTNKVKLEPGESLYFSHNIRDRKFDEKLNPELDLWLDASGKAGLELAFEIGFQAWEENTLIEGKYYLIKFNNYTTKGTSGGENAKVSFKEYVGKPFNINYGSDNWASVYLMVNLTDSTSGSSIDILCGAKGKTSNIRLPWNQTLSEYESQQDTNDNDNGSICGFIFMVGLAIILVPGCLIVIDNQRRTNNLKYHSPPIQTTTKCTKNTERE